MKKQIQLLAILLISNLTISGQSLKPLREQIKDKYSLKSGIPVRIVETIKDYKNSGIVESKKEFIDFSQNSDTISRSRYDSGDLEMLHICVYDQKNNKVAENSKRRIKNKGWITLETNYYYDKNGLSEVKTTHNLDYKEIKISTTAIVDCDSLGNLTDSKLYNSDKALILHETGEYDYRNNSWTYSVYDSIGQLRRQEKLEIIPTKKFNDKGDVILYARDSQEKNKTFYRVDYKYDEFGNWVEKKIYQFRNDGDKALNEKLFQTISRKIEYKKN